MSMKSRLPLPNLAISTGSLAKALTTRLPSRVSSIWALSSPIWFLCLRNASFTFRLNHVQEIIITGTSTNMSRVSSRLIPDRIMKETTVLRAAMKNSSGQWWANSVTSNKSLVIRDMICPTFVLL